MKKSSHCKPAIDLKKAFGHHYRIKLDPAAMLIKGNKRDPWMYIIPCKYGEIYPYSQEDEKPVLLGLLLRGQNKRAEFKKKFPEFEVRNWSDDGEAIFLFPLDRYEEVASFVGARKKKSVSTEQAARLRRLAKQRRLEEKKDTDICMSSNELNLKEEIAPLQKVSS